MPANYTNPRPGRSAALLFGVQAAKGTLVSDFTAADTGRIWSTLFEAAPALELVTPPEGYMSRGGAPSVDYDTGVGPGGRIVCHATPESVEYFLRNGWGSFAGGAFTRLAQVGEWLTLAWVEDRFDAGTSTERLVRLRDCLIHALAIDVDSDGMVMLEAQYRGAARTNTPLDTIGGITLPSAPMQPADQNVYAGRSATLIRDPAGDNETLSFARLSVEIDANLIEDWTMSSGYLVAMAGEHDVTLQIEALVADEFWNIIDQVNASIPQDYRLTVTAPSPASTLTLDFRDVTWRPGMVGSEGQEYRRAAGTGYPRIKADGSFVDITIS